MFLQINNLTFSYSNSSTQLFDDFSLTFYDGWTTLAGSNGTGKSTLLKLIAFQIFCDDGKILFNGNLVTKEFAEQIVDAEPASFKSSCVKPIHTCASKISPLYEFPCLGKNVISLTS